MSLGANDFSLEELDKLFQEDGQETPPVDEINVVPGEPPVEQPVEETPPTDVSQTKAFANRLKQEKAKAKQEALDEIAVSLGYSSYADLKSAQQKKLLDDNGLDPEQVGPIVDKLVEERLKNDPRLAELENYKQKQMIEFAQRELAEVNKLAGTNFQSLDEIPPDVLEDWKKTGSLKKSYISLHGEELITKARAASAKGTTSHLQNPSGGAPAPTSRRPLTEEEKNVWRLFHPGITDEELNKKFKET